MSSETFRDLIIAMVTQERCCNTHIRRIMRFGTTIRHAGRGLLLCILLHVSISTAWGASGIIQSVLGTARVSQQSGLERPAQKGVQLYPGDTITTNEKSRVQIRMIDEAMIWIHPESSLTIDKYSYTKQGDSKDQAVLRLVTGGLRTVTGFIGKVNRNNYSLSTPNAVLGIRGTDFQVSFVSPGKTSQPAPASPGTYNHVFLGATVLNSNGSSINVDQGQTAFAALTPGIPPQLLPARPPFMDAQQGGGSAGNPAAGTAAGTAAPAPTTPPTRMLLITLRFAPPPAHSSAVTTSSRNARPSEEEQTVRVLDGAKATMAISQSTPSVTRQGSGAQQGMVVELSPRLAGNTVTVQIQALRTGSSAGGASSQSVATTINVALSEWIEVTGRGPFASNSLAETTSSRNAKAGAQAIYLKVDEVNR